MRHKLVCILPLLSPRSHVVWTRKIPLMYPEGRRLWGFNPPLNLRFVFQLCMHKKYCPRCAPVFIKFKNFVQEKVKMCTLFSHFASVYWLCPWTQFGDFCSPDALAPPILYNSWYTSCETLHRELLGTPMVQPIPISIPSRLLAVAPQTLG